MNEGAISRTDEACTRDDDDDAGGHPHTATTRVNTLVGDQNLAFDLAVSLSRITSRA